MTPEERAEIARKNGAKSKGPTTPEGKAKVSRNGIKTGEYAETLSNFVPPDCAILCNEERQAFFELMDALLETYQPKSGSRLSPPSCILAEDVETGRDVGRQSRDGDSPCG